MKQNKSAKRSLIFSVLSLLLCCAMLVGTTFAWFTDSVTSGNNKIVAGNLDVELYHSSATVTDEKVTENTLLFVQQLWEPGVAVFENFKVANEGTLALKYQLMVNFTNAVKTPSGKTLADVLKVGVVEGGVDVKGTRDAVVRSVQNWAPLASFALNDALAAGDSDIYGVVIWWEPSDIDNEFNMNNENKGTVLSIDLGVTLIATQVESELEFDSFGSDYDAGAWVETMTVATEAELITAMKAAIGKNVQVTLAKDIVLTGNWTPIGNKDAGEYFMGTLDGNGHTISGLNVAANDYDALISAAKDATVKNLTVEGTVNGVNAAGIVARVEGNTIIENCVSNVTVSGTTKAGGIACNVTGADAKIVNCVNNADISGGNSGIGGIVGYVNNDAYVEIVNCANNGNVTSDNNKYAGAAVGYAAGTSKGVVAGFTNAGAITGTLLGDGRYLKDGETVLCGYVGTIGNWTVANAITSADQLVNAFANLTAQDVLYIGADLDMTGKTIAPVTGNKGFSMYGNGYTISNLSSTANALFVAHSGSSVYMFNGVVLENCSVNSATDYGALFVGDGDTSDAITIEDCHVKNCTVESAKYAAAFVGYTAGWNVQNDGPVYSDVLIENCSVTGGSITGGGSTGAAVAHSGGNPDTTTTITNLTVDGVAINGEDAAHTGIVVGTANIGQTIINNAKYENVTGNYNGLYGRLVSGTTGSLVIDGVAVYNQSTPLAAALTANRENINVVLDKDVDLPISSLGQQTGGSGEYKLGGANTKAITIDLNGKKLNITTTYWSAIGANNADATITIKNGSMTSTGNSAGTWNAWDLRFSNCNWNFENVDFGKAVALDNAGKVTNMNDVTITDSHNTDTYALWITAEGQTVNIDGLTVDMLAATDGRGIKIDEQYVDSAAKVALTVKNATFKTEEKSAILVKSVAGADIALSNVNIANTIDPLHAVWVDEDAAAAAYDLVTVTGGKKANEAEVAISLADLQSKVNQASGEVYFEIVNDITGNLTVTQKPGVEITIDGNNKTFAGVITVDGKSATYTTAGLTIKNVNFDAKGIADASIKMGGTNATRYICNLTVENCTFVGNYPAEEKSAIKSYTGGDKNLTVIGCTAINMHTLVQVKNVTGLTVTDCTVIGGKNGISAGTSSDVNIKGCNIEAIGYGIRLESNDSTVANPAIVIADCEIKAFIPVVMRNANYDASVTFKGTNTMTETNNEGLWFAIGIEEYGDVDKAGLTPASGKITVTLNGTGLVASGVYGAN